MTVRRATLAGLLVSLIAVGSARADTVVVNSYSGLWNTTLTYQGASIPGTVKFTAIDATTGANALEAIGGHACGAPTTYYHGDYTDMPSGGTTQTGVMTACIVTAGHLVGRWAGGGDQGDLDITLNSAKNGFDGSFSDDMFGITQPTGAWNGTRAP